MLKVGDKTTFLGWTSETSHKKMTGTITAIKKYELTSQARTVTVYQIDTHTSEGTYEVGADRIIPF